MKIYFLFVLLSFGLLTTACSRKDDAPPPNNPHVGGIWIGTGTDDTLGFYNVEFTLTQSGNSAAGSFTISNSLVSMAGNVKIDFGVVSPTNLTNVDFSSIVCSEKTGATICDTPITLVPNTGHITSNNIGFNYTMNNKSLNGGASLNKTVGTN